ncbi:MAG: GtrA family protein [Candidatus Solibacter usitatus]|nr:GtrA family protein [Candidatus Solibacter usitatus]
MIRHWLRFNAVGAAGVAVQLGMLRLLHEFLHLPCLPATALAVETAVLHNYWWHWKWTWSDRSSPASSLLRFQCTTGLVSIAGNLMAMKLILQLFDVPVLTANALSICLLYAFNFLVSDRYVFRLR